MQVIKSKQQPNGKPLFDVEIDDNRYEVWGDEVRLVRVIHGCKQYVSLPEMHDGGLRQKILAACVAS